MSTSVFDRALAIRGDKPPSIKVQDGGIVMRGRPGGSEVTCPPGGGTNVVRQTFAKTPARDRTGSLARYGHLLSTGPLDGANNKIKTRWRQADGFRDSEDFALKIKALRHSRFELVG